MIVINTSFHVDAAIEEEFRKWLRDEFLTMIDSQEGIDTLSVSHLLLTVEEGLTSYAVRVGAPSLTLEEALELWEGGRPAEALADVMRRFNNRVLHFTTPMEDIEL